MIANAFASQYKNYSEKELLDIINSEEDYQPEAIKAANAELASRGFNAEELEQLNSEWLASHLLKLEKQGNTFEKRLKSTANEVAKRANPLNKTGINREIALIIYSSAALLILRFIGEFDYLFLIVEYLFFDAGTLLTYMPFVFVPVGLYYFNKRDRLGWTILNCWYVHVIILILPMIDLPLKETDFLGFRYPSILSLFIGGCIYGCLLYASNKKSIKEEFKISSGFQTRTLVFSAAITILLFFYI